MKKILIATTALVATAGVAAAEVSISGYARFGVQYTEGTAAVAAVAGKGLTTAQSTAAGTVDAAGAYTSGAVTALVAGTVDATDAQILAARNALAAAQAAAAAANTALAAGLAADDIADAEANLAALLGTAAVAAVEDSTDVVSRLRIQFDAKTTTDAGIGLNFRQRFQTEEGSTGNGGNGARFGLSYEGLSVNVGNIVGVIEGSPNLYMGTNSGGIGLEGHSWSNLAVNNAGGRFGWTAYDSAGAGADNGVEVMYSANGLGLHVHTTEGSTGYAAKYSISNVTLAAAREDFDNGDEITFASAGVGIGNGKVAVSWGDTNGTTKSVIAAGYDMAPGANIHAFVGSEDAGESYGVGVNYSLGGGASFDAGVDADAAGRTRMSAGLFFTF